SGCAPARTRRGVPPRCAGSRPTCGRSRTGSPGSWGLQWWPRRRMLVGTLRRMRVTAISDLHGAVEHLDTVGKECDALLVLGDLINVLDYRTMDGILVEVFGREPVAAAAEL